MTLRFSISLIPIMAGPSGVSGVSNEDMAFARFPIFSNIYRNSTFWRLLARIQGRMSRWNLLCQTGFQDYRKRLRPRDTAALMMCRRCCRQPLGV